MSDGASKPSGELPSVQITRGNPSNEDLAALASLLPAVYAAESRDATADEPARGDAWRAATRMRRTPNGARWGRFAG